MADENINIPWVEKYRPNKFEDIVLDKYNKIIMQNIIDKKNFPNLLLYGPPGTGKTTTIINLIKSFQERNHNPSKELIIHLNASDERGIDIIRNNISQFVNSKNLFNQGLKFVILDEVDSMTKNAQYALKYLLQGFNKKVRFCLICNYISRIDESLQNEFVRLRFNQLPKEKIVGLLKKINNKENLYYTIKELSIIQETYNSDIRSMINYMQSNNLKLNGSPTIITDNTWLQLIEDIKTHDNDTIYNILYDISITYNIDLRQLIIDFLNYIIRYHNKYVTDSYLQLCKNIMHAQNINIFYYKKYFINEFKNILLHNSNIT